MNPTPSFKSKSDDTAIEGQRALLRAELELFELLHNVSFCQVQKNPPHHRSGEAGLSSIRHLDKRA
jgi:hypothetical protein